MKKLVWGLVLAAVAAGACAQSAGADAGARVGLGQPSAKEPPKIGRLQLNDPLVQQKYLNNPDMLRFLRATYAEACTRGMLNQVATQVKLNPDKTQTEDQQKLASQLLESKRMWKMGSFELEAVFGRAYLVTANYCDCLMQEVTNNDLVDPKRGLEVVEKLSPSVTNSCERMARDKTASQKDTFDPARNDKAPQPKK